VREVNVGEEKRRMAGSRKEMGTGEKVDKGKCGKSMNVGEKER